MKILHTVESYLPARHGMSEVVRQISERLVQRGHQVTVATSKDSRRQSEQIEGVEVRGFDVHGKSAIGVWGDVSGYQKFLLDFNPDIIVATPGRLLDLIAAASVPGSFLKVYSYKCLM